MNPNQQPGVDYLNSIAPKQTRQPFMSTLKPIHFIIGIVGILILITIIIAIIGGVSSASRAPGQQLAARLATTSRIATASHEYLKSGRLRTLNSNLQIFLTGINAEIKAPLKTVGIDAGKLDPGIVASEAGAQLTARIEDARLEARIDSRYAEEMAYKLSGTLELMEKIYKSTSSRDLKEFLEKAYNDLQPTQQQFAAFNES